MELTTVHIKNFRSIVDSGPIALARGVTTIIGKNNSGKSALLESLTINIDNDPTRNARTVHVIGGVATSGSEVSGEIRIDQREFRSLLSKDRRPFVLSRKNQPGSLDDWQQLRQAAAIDFSITRNHALNSVTATLSAAGTLFSDGTGSGPAFRYDPQTDSVSATHDGPAHIAHIIMSQLLSRIFRFRAERMNIGVAESTGATELRSDGVNLPDVLATLQTNRLRFDRFNDYIRRVLPQIESISAVPIGGGQYRIVVRDSEDARLRDDLAIPLQSSGTGISQILCMLYVTTMSEHPRVLLVDEPQSFLHPGAVRALLEVFEEHPHHQYVIATHSPLSIGRERAGKHYVVRKVDGATRIDSYEASDVKRQREVLEEVGASLLDVFAAERVLWVEGKTEERCFPIIAHDFLRTHPAAILGVLATGDFDHRHRKLTVKVYEALSTSGAILPPVVGFVFDRERLNSEDVKRIQEHCPGKVHFLKRRMFENYLLDPGAIVAIIAKVGGADASAVAPRVDEWIRTHQSDSKYGASGAPAGDWISVVDGAKFLTDMFMDLEKIPYDKVTHSVALAEWLADRKPETFADIRELLVEVLSRAPGGSS